MCIRDSLNAVAAADMAEPVGALAADGGDNLACAVGFFTVCYDSFGNSVLNDNIIDHCVK